MTGRRERRKEREAVFVQTFGNDASLALDLVEIVDRAWSDVYGAPTPPPEILDDLLVCSRGTLAGLIEAAHLGLTDWRDLRMQAASLSDASGR